MCWIPNIYGHFSPSHYIQYANNKVLWWLAFISPKPVKTSTGKRNSMEQVTSMLNNASFYYGIERSRGATLPDSVVSIRNKWALTPHFLSANRKNEIKTEVISYLFRYKFYHVDFSSFQFKSWVRLLLKNYLASDIRKSYS